MRRVRLAAAGWSAEANQASTFVERFQGLRSRSTQENLLIRTRSVHTFGLKGPIAVVVLDRERRVVATRALHPNRILIHRLARYMLEVPLGSALPPLDSRMEIVDV